MYLNRSSNNFQKTELAIIVSSLVLRFIHYCIRIWGTNNETLLLNDPKLQNFAAKVAVGGMLKYDPVSRALKELNWLNIKQKQVFDTNYTTFKILRGVYPEWFKSFDTVNNVARSLSRQQNDLYTPRANTDTGARSLAMLGPKLWNALPNLIFKSKPLYFFWKRLVHEKDT